MGLQEGACRRTRLLKRSSSTGVAVAGEVTDILRRDEDLITGVTDCGCTRRQDHVGVEGVRRSGWYATLAGVGPEEGGVTPSASRNRLIRQSSQSNQMIETTE